MCTKHRCAVHPVPDSVEFLAHCAARARRNGAVAACKRDDSPRRRAVGGIEWGDGRPGGRRGVSLPLDARGWLGADVVEHAVHAFDAVEDLVGGVAEHFIGQPDPFGGHGVFADDGTEGDGLLVAAFVAFDAYGFHGKQGGIGLPGLLIPAAAAEFADEDGIGLLGDGNSLGRDLAGDAHGEAGAGEWMTPEGTMRDA